MRATSPKPVIALSGKMTESDGAKLSSRSVLNMKTLLERAGADVVVIDPAYAYPPALTLYDAVVFMGNDYDIDPLRYHAEAIHPATRCETLRDASRSEADYLLAMRRAEYEYSAMEIAWRNAIPIFAVCGGMQRLNVVLGGTLIQHVEGRMKSEGPSLPVQHIDVRMGSMLFSISGDAGIYAPAPDETQPHRRAVNALHHQAVDRLGEGLRVSATCTGEGIIEAVESATPGRFALGVQWHPEFMPGNALSRKLVQATISAARAYAARKPEIFGASLPAYQIPAGTVEDHRITY